MILSFIEFFINFFFDVILSIIHVHILWNLTDIYFTRNLYLCSRGSLLSQDFLSYSRGQWLSERRLNLIKLFSKSAIPWEVIFWQLEKDQIYILLFIITVQKLEWCFLRKKVLPNLHLSLRSFHWWFHCSYESVNDRCKDELITKKNRAWHFPKNSFLSNLHLSSSILHL